MTDRGLEMGGYRYSLYRDIPAIAGQGAGVPPRVLFIMLNPSTATDETDDPTIRRCMGFAESWGYGTMHVVNLFALRATKPESLRYSRDPIGKENDSEILIRAINADLVVCAWGNHGRLYNRGAHVVRMLTRAGIDLHCLGVTRAGQPKHPLYINKNQQPVVFAQADAENRSRP